MILRRLARKARNARYRLAERYLEGNGQLVTRSLSNSQSIGVRDDAFYYDKVKYCDKIRILTLELCAREVYRKEIAGNVAEVGVYRGRFAVRINELFPDRKLYLFDTFYGFDSHQQQHDVEHGLSSVQMKFDAVDPTLVLDQMKYPSNCILKAGPFVDTVSDVEDQFAFVSIDVDLFIPTSEAIDYFYPRLSRGGYIFVHDYNNDDWHGVRDAVEKHCEVEGLACVPIPDAQGTLVITKG